MIAVIIAAVLSLFGTDAGLITEPAPSPYVWGEVPLLPEAAYSPARHVRPRPRGRGQQRGPRVPAGRWLGGQPG